MRKNRFLMNLIAATAIGLAAIGCDSSSSGAIGDASDLNSNANNAAQQASLHEFLIIGQRGLFQNSVTVTGTNRGTPTVPTAPAGRIVIGEPGDAVVTRSLAFPIRGVASVPTPNAVLDASQPLAANATATSGAHGAFVDPTGKFVVTMTRAKNRGFGTDNAVLNAILEISALRLSPIDTTFPPVLNFGTVQDPTPTRLFTRNQGEFVSGAWSTDARHFYASIEGTLITYTVDGTVGRLTPAQVQAFPNQPAAGFNNAAKLLSAPSGAFIFAIDHAGNNILTYTRNTTTGILALTATTPVPADCRGMTIESTGQFLYAVSRSSQFLSGFRIAANGALTPIEVTVGAGAIPFNFGSALGDVDANPQTSTVFIATYAGALQGFNVNTTTGALTAIGAADALLGSSRNTANIEVDPTGRFLFSANEHDYESFDQFSGEFPVFANLDTTTNATVPFSPTAQADDNGLTVLITPTDPNLAFVGDIQIARINADGTVRYERSQAAENPYSLDFVQRVLLPPFPNP